MLPRRNCRRHFLGRSPNREIRGERFFLSTPPLTGLSGAVCVDAHSLARHRDFPVLIAFLFLFRIIFLHIFATVLRLSDRVRVKCGLLSIIYRPASRKQTFARCQDGQMAREPIALVPFYSFLFS